MNWSDIKQSPERVIGLANRYFSNEWQNPTGTQVFMQREGHVGTAFALYTRIGFFPQTALGWIFNLSMTFLTLGSWSVPWLLYAWFSYDSPRKLVRLTAYPEGDATGLELSGNDEALLAEVEAWLNETFPQRSYEELQLQF